MAFEDIKIGDRVIVNDNGTESGKVKVIGFFYLVDMDLATATSAKEAIDKADSGFYGVVVELTKPKDQRIYFKNLNGFGFEEKDILMVSPLQREEFHSSSDLIKKINNYRIRFAQKEISNLDIWTYDDILLEAKRLGLV